MTQDPRELPVPEGSDLLKRVEIFAKDLAYGCNVGEWESSFTYLDNINVWRGRSNDLKSTEASRLLERYCKDKWNNSHPTANDLALFEYVKAANGGVYSLTKAAFDLLNRPAVPANVFISYKRKESSAFALLVEARLVMAGATSPHIDKNLKGGEPWHARLEERVKSSEYLVCLIGPTTLESDAVKKEIWWAIEAGRFIIPVCHNGQTLAECEKIMRELTVSNGYEIKGDPDGHSAADYEAAVSFILNSLGYRTI